MAKEEQKLKEDLIKHQVLNNRFNHRLGLLTLHEKKLIELTLDEILLHNRKKKDKSKFLRKLNKFIFNGNYVNI